MGRGPRCHHQAPGATHGTISNAASSAFARCSCCFPECSPASNMAQTRPDAGNGARLRCSSPARQRGHSGRLWAEHRRSSVASTAREGVGCGVWRSSPVATESLDPATDLPRHGAAATGGPEGPGVGIVVGLRLPCAQVAWTQWPACAFWCCPPRRGKNSVLFFSTTREEQFLLYESVSVRTRTCMSIPMVARRSSTWCYQNLLVHLLLPSGRISSSLRRRWRSRRWWGRF